MATHPGPTALFDILSYWAHWVWLRRARAKAARMAFSEETITETLLLDLATALPGQLHIEAFTKPKEGKTGADWEWCFYDLAAGHFFRMLIQAKSLDARDQAYTKLYYKVGKPKPGKHQPFQIARLRATAARRGVPAMYVFYNHLTDARRLPPSPCHCCAGCADCWGCSIAHADAIWALRWDNSFDTLRHISMPWACIACLTPSRSDPPSGPEAVRQGLQLFEAQVVAGAREFGMPPPPRHEYVLETTPPSYFDEVRKGSPDSSDTERSARLARRNPGVDGVVLVDLGRDPDRHI
ncbi:MAG TPA: DUF6615 family protein [Caulobacteraceae bacterium]